MTSLRRWSCTCALAAVLSLLASRADASLIVIDWNAVDDQLVVRDTITGLDWLKPVVTDGLSFNTVLSQTTGAGTYAGWRYATLGEVQTLLTISAGISIPALEVGYENAALYAPVHALIDLFGATEVYPAITVFGGRFDTGSPTMNGLVFLGYRPTLTGMADIHTCCNTRTHSSVDYGSFLVRTSPVAAVPEPATVGLVGLGLMLVARHAGSRRARTRSRDTA